MIKIKLRNIFEIKTGILIKKELRGQLGHKIIYPKDIDEFYDINFDFLENYGEIKTFFKNKLQINDILLETKDPFRVTILKDPNILNCGLLASSNFIILRKIIFLENNNKYNPDLICAVLKSKSIRKIFKKYTEDKLVINQYEVGEIDIPDLSNDEMEILIETIQSFYKRKKIMLSLKKELEYNLTEDNKKLLYKINKYIK
ncbi:hypothetical protein [Cetobacterium sp. SF1]|uniref:hypothetical protein n=1 Tax=Cetobacterium sp. SF1 TaxID=3417654 RepID=UPI003CED3B92